MPIKIYDLCGADEALFFSPHCWKTRMSLAHKGLDYESIPTPFTAVATVENGESRRVPVIRDGETVVEDSLEIAKYLDKAYPDAPQLLGGEAGLALTTFIVDWSQLTLHPLVAKLAMLDIHNVLAPADQDFFRRTREKMFGITLEEFDAKFGGDTNALETALAPLNLMLKKQPYIGGETPLFADYVVFGALQWLRTIKGDTVLPQEGRVAEWFGRLLDMYDGLGRRAKLAVAA